MMKRCSKMPPAALTQGAPGGDSLPTPAWPGPWTPNGPFGAVGWKRYVELGYGRMRYFFSCAFLWPIPLETTI